MVFTRDDYLVDIRHRLEGMRKQEASSHYTIPDYLAVEWQQKLREVTEAMQHCNVSIVHGAGDDVSSSSAPSVVVAGVGDAFQARAAHAAVVAATANQDAPPPNDVGPDANQGSSSECSDEVMNQLWREKICEWCYQVIDHFGFNREAVSVAMTYLDRYLATRTVNRRIFQLAAMTALYLAIKLYEPGKLRMSVLIDLSRGYFVAEHVVTMELSMLQSLGWHVHPKTPLAFVHDFMRLVSGEIDPIARHDVCELGRFMTELSVCDYWFVTKKPSSIALAGLVNAIELQGPRRVDPRYKIEFLTRVVDLGIDIASDEEILACYERLRQMYDAGGYTPTLAYDPAVPAVAAAAPAAAVGGNGVEDEDVQEPAARRSPTAIVDSSELEPESESEPESDSESDSESEPEFEAEPWPLPEPHQPEEHHEPETLGKPKAEPELEAKPRKSDEDSKCDYGCYHSGKRGKVLSEPEPDLKRVGDTNATLSPSVVRTVSPEVKKKKTVLEHWLSSTEEKNDSRKTPPEVLSFDENQHGRKSNKRKKSDEDD